MHKYLHVLYGVPIKCEPIIDELIMNGIYVIDKENENKEECDEYDNVDCRILYQQPNIILPLIIDKSIPKLYSNDILIDCLVFN